MGNSIKYDKISQIDLDEKRENKKRDKISADICSELKFTLPARLVYYMTYLQTVDAPSLIESSKYLKYHTKNVETGKIESHIVDYHSHPNKAILKMIPNKNSSHIWNISNLVKNNSFIMPYTCVQDVTLGIYSSESKIGDIFIVSFENKYEDNRCASIITHENRFTFILENQFPLLTICCPFTNIKINFPLHWKNIYLYGIQFEINIRDCLAKNIWCLQNLGTFAYGIFRKSFLPPQIGSIYPIYPRTPQIIVYDFLRRCIHKYRLKKKYRNCFIEIPKESYKSESNTVYPILRQRAIKI